MASSSGTHAIGAAVRAQIRETLSAIPATPLRLEPGERFGELEVELRVAREQLAQLAVERERLENRMISARGQVALLEGIVHELARSSAVEPQRVDASSQDGETARIARPLSIPPDAVNSPQELEPALARVVVRTLPFVAPVADRDARSRQQLRLVGRTDSPEEQDVEGRCHEVDPSTCEGTTTASGRHARSCEIEAEFLEDTHLFRGLGHDLVGAGIFVATYQTLAQGVAVELELELPHGLARARGEVRWTRPERKDADQRPGVAIVFVGLPPEGAAPLTDALRSPSTRYYEA